MISFPTYSTLHLHGNIVSNCIIDFTSFSYGLMIVRYCLGFANFMYVLYSTQIDSMYMHTKVDLTVDNEKKIIYFPLNCV